jgi:AcrR family transcriptional regulator
MGKQPVSAGRTSPTGPSQRRPRRSREEGKDLLRTAAADLLRTRNPDDISVREIGDRATIHHRFINEWFGGKVGLFREVHESWARDISEIVATITRAGAIPPATFESMQRQVLLVAWLIQNESEFDDLEAAFPAITSGRSTLVENFGLTYDDADMTAHIIGAIILADFQMRPHVNVRPSTYELIAHALRSATGSVRPSS